MNKMSELSQEQLRELQGAFELTQDSGVVDQYGAKKMLQIFNMNPTTEDVAKRYAEFGRDATAGLTFEEFEHIFRDYLMDFPKVPDALKKTLTDLFDGPITKAELRKILTEMGSEPFEPEEADEVLSEIRFDDQGLITREALQQFLLNKVDLRLPPSTSGAQEGEPTGERPSPVASRHAEIEEDDF
ncbi:hypothetical protein DPMN_069398 [Dreissena polymorpha]|uniref:Uncharacterized protein n=1 Tax=Dreissena polymorpha TaxID=45954 RepID=A0A9D3Z418_DREPO|nr:hypothetical protein DPMN_069398 [Dreissena polymorpha]